MCVMKYSSLDPAIRVLFCSRDQKLQVLVAPALRADFNVVVEANRDRVKWLVAQHKCDVVILDLDCFIAGEQLEFFDELRNLSIPVLVIADDASPDTARELVRRGVHDCFRKPPAIPELKVAVREIHENARWEREHEDSGRNSNASSGCDQLIGSSLRSQLVYDLIRRVSDLDAFILITGESGTGKELIARAIHNLSARARSPFVAVTCGAIPESLIEAELFGSEKGAFTGAAGRRKGYLEEAGDGTLLLDEIGELSPHTQVKLLRVLQQREFTRLGSSVAIPLRARVLFATHRNLKLMVDEGSFRQDLYYRVNVIEIQSPSLRDRSEDIPELARHFLNKYANTYRSAVTKIQPGAMALLLQYEWPGNIRELENVIQGAIVLSDDDSISPENLPAALRQTIPLRANDSVQWSSFEGQLRDYKIKLALDAVKDCNGNKTLAAQSLQISRTYLHRLIKDPGDPSLVLNVA